MSSDASIYFINVFVNYWCSSTLISIILLITSNLKCFVMKYFVRICFSGYIFVVTISGMVLKTGLVLILRTDISSFYRISSFALNFCILVLLCMNSTKKLYINQDCLNESQTWTSGMDLLSIITYWLSCLFLYT